MTYDIYNDLLNIGCCNRCCLRFMGEKYANFEDPITYLKELFPLKFTEDIQSKKIKTNPCCICLGLLEDQILDFFLNQKCWKEFINYDTDTYRINLQTPPNLSIRNKSIHLYLKEKFPEHYKKYSLDENEVPVHIVFKLAFKTKLDNHCGKIFNVHSDVQLLCELEHENNEKETQIMSELDPITYKKRQRMGDKMFSKNAIIQTLTTVDEKILLKNIKVPPTIPTNPIKVISLAFESIPIYIAGRYTKFSRQLSQTPWSFDNDNTEEKQPPITNCIQNIIFDGINEIFKFDKDKMTFTSSGREDTDVRCLGSGRPFFVKIDGVKKTYPEELFRNLEELINRSNEVKVYDMQQSNKYAIKEVKQGEELKRKGYIALCLIKDKSKKSKEIVEKINEIGLKSLACYQKTPIRVAHRRTLSVRKKMIYHMNAFEIPNNDNLFQLFLVVQAGTYIKEFIYGDFGRTKPSLSDLVDTEIDIFLLDVVGIDLNWPNHINSIPHPLVNKKGFYHSSDINC